MWKEIVEKTGAKRWDYFIVSGTGDMPVFEYEGQIHDNWLGDDYLCAFDAKGRIIGSFLELNDAKKAVEVAAHG